MADRDLIKDKDCVEAELLPEGSYGPLPESGPARPAAPLPQPGLFTRLKIFIGGALMLLALGLIVLGVVLTSTVIGAIVGIPLILAGAGLLALFFRLFAAGLQKFVVFRKFP